MRPSPGIKLEQGLSGFGREFAVAQSFPRRQALAEHYILYQSGTLCDDVL